MFPKGMFFVFVFLALVLSSPASWAQGTKNQERHAHIRLLSEKKDLLPGTNFSIAIEERLTDGWHTYWRNPGDSGTPMRIKWHVPEGFSVADLHWPVPHPVPYGPLMNYGYEGEAVFLQDFSAPDPLPPGPLTFRADIEVLVCMEICIPEQDSYTIIVGEPGTPLDPPLFAQARASIPKPIPAKGLWIERDGNFILEARIQDAALRQDLLSGHIRFFPEEWGMIENAADQSIVFQDDTLRVVQKRGSRPLKEVPSSRMLLVVDAPSGQAHGYVLEAQGAPNGILDLSGSGANPSGIGGFLYAVLLALLGGVILNLMPCVFPVLSIKALGSVRLAAHHPWKARLHGLLYTAGILVSFLFIAGVLILLRAEGDQIGWGFQLQNPVMVISLAFLLFTIGLNLLGVFDLVLPVPARLGRHFSGEEGSGGAFLTGVLATFVATPCTAPFMGTAIGYAMTQPAPVSLFVFAALGLGLALPYLSLSFFPVLQRAMPRPGAWMEVFRQLLAFPMFLSAAWLVWVLAQQSGSGGVLAALVGGIGIAFSLWALRTPARRPRRVWLLRVAAAAGFVMALESVLWVERQPLVSEAISPADMFGERFSRAALETALQGESPVFVEMTAAWCITCKVNHGLAIDIPATREVMSRRGVRYLIGDWTNADPEITAYLSSFGRNGVPLYVYYAPADRPGGNRPDPVVLPQILTPGLMAQTFEPKDSGLPP